MTVALSLRLPWWTPAYFAALHLVDGLGLVEIDVDIAAAFVLRHSRVVVEEV